MCAGKRRRHTGEQGCQGDSRGYPVVFVVGKVAFDGVPGVILEHVTGKTQDKTMGECGRAKARRRMTKDARSPREVCEVGFEEHPLHDVAPAYAYFSKRVAIGDKH
jgi:hypothetical protein